MEELDRFIEQMEKDVEGLVRDAVESGRKIVSKPFLYGFSMKVGPEGEPVIQTFGDKKAAEGFREPVHDQFLDNERDTLKLLVELPGVDKKDINLQASEAEGTVNTTTTERKYRAEIKFRSPVDPNSGDALYRNGVLEVTFKLKDKANKGFTKIGVE